MNQIFLNDKKGIKNEKEVKTLRNKGIKRNLLDLELQFITITSIYMENISLIKSRKNG